MNARSKALMPYPGQLMFKFMSDRRYGRRVKARPGEAQQEGPPVEAIVGRTTRGKGRRAG